MSRDTGAETDMIRVGVCTQAWQPISIICIIYMYNVHVHGCVGLWVCGWVGGWVRGCVGAVRARARGCVCACVCAYAWCIHQSFRINNSVVVCREAIAIYWNDINIMKHNLYKCLHVSANLYVDTGLYVGWYSIVQLVWAWATFFLSIISSFWSVVESDIANANCVGLL